MLGKVSGNGQGGRDAQGSAGTGEGEGWRTSHGESKGKNNGNGKSRRGARSRATIDPKSASAPASPSGGELPERNVGWIVTFVESQESFGVYRNAAGQVMMRADADTPTRGATYTRDCISSEIWRCTDPGRSSTPASAEPVFSAHAPATANRRFAP